MNSAGLIVIAIFGGALLVLLIAGMLVLGWVLWQTKQQVAAHNAKLDVNNAEMKAAIEGAKSSFATIRAEMGRQQAEFLTKTHDILQIHATAIGGVVGKINGEALEAASTRAMQACSRMEKMVVSIQQLLLTVDPVPENNLGAEQYAPNDSTIYSTISDVARGDREAEIEESQDTLSFR